MKRSWAVWLILFLMILQTGAAVWILPKLEFHADLTVESDQEPRVNQSLEKEQSFPSPNPLVFLVPSQGSPFSSATLERLGRLIQALETTGLPLKSIASVEVGEGSSEGRRSRPLWTPGTPGERLESDLKTHPMYENLFLNPERTAWVVYVPTRGDGQAEVKRVEPLVEPLPGVVVGGEPWFRNLLDRALARNMMLLMPGSLFVLFVVFLFLTRNPGTAFRLIIVSCQPALGILLAFPLTNTPFNFSTILAPLMALALATTYTIHIHHHLAEHGPGWGDLFQKRGRAVFWSALISALGFSSLLLSPLPALRFLGLLLVAGLALTLFWCLIGLPLIDSRIRHSQHSEPTLRIGERRPWAVPVLLLVALLALPGSYWLTAAFHWSDYLKPDSRESKSLGQFEELFPAWQEVSLHLSVGGAGWLEPGRWSRLEGLVASWKEQYPSVRIWSVQDAVRGVLPELGLPAESSEPEALGQALEFLPPDQEIGKLINGNRTELVVRWAFDPAEVRNPHRAAVLERLRNDAQTVFPEATICWAGPYYRQILSLESFLTGELWGMAGFYLFTWAVIVVRLRSWKRGTQAMIPSLLSAGVFLGLAGWLQWPISPATALVAAACIGQTTDDGLLWSLLSPTESVRASLAESTILLSAGLATLAFSTFANIAEAGILVIVALCFSTAMVLWFLPWRMKP